MKSLIRLAVLALAFTASAAAQATTFNFSYTFNSAAWFGIQPTTVVTGTFTGTAAGNLISDLGNIALFENGVAFNGNGSLFSSNVNADGTVSLFAGVASFDGMQNNFNFTDGSSNNFFMAPDVNHGGLYAAYLLKPDLSLYAIDVSADGVVGPASGNWTISAIDDAATAVPEPATCALIAAGLALLALHTPRRRPAGRPLQFA